MFPPTDDRSGAIPEPEPHEWRSDADGLAGHCTAGEAGASGPLPCGMDDPEPALGDAAAQLQANFEVGGLGGLAAAVAEFADAGVLTLSDGEIAAQLGALPALVARLEAAATERLGLFDARRAFAGSGHRNGASWWAAHSPLPKETAAAALRRARGLRHSSVVADAFAAGRISADAAGLLADYASRNAALFAPQAPTFVEVATTLTKRELRQLLEIWADLAAPSEGAKNEAKRWASRRFEHRTGPDGRLHGSFALDVPEALLFGEVFRHFEELVRLADEAPDDRDGGQRRADAFAAMLTALRDDLPTRARADDDDATNATTGDGTDAGPDAASPDGASPNAASPNAGSTASARRGRRADVSVVIPFELFGGDGTALAHIGGQPLALTAELARFLTCDASISAMVFSGHQPLTAGRSCHAFPDRIRKAIMRRDGGCAFPGCGMTPRFCDAHHIWHWDDGGPTDADNGVALCRYHHRLLHHGRWKVWIDLDTETPRFRRLDPGERTHRHAHQRTTCCDATPEVHTCDHRAWRSNRTHHVLIDAANTLSRNSFERNARPPRASTGDPPLRT